MFFKRRVIFDLVNFLWYGREEKKIILGKEKNKKGFVLEYILWLEKSKYVIRKCGLEFLDKNFWKFVNRGFFWLNMVLER